MINPMFVRLRLIFVSPTPHDVNLASRYRVRWELRPLGLPPKVRDMPVILEKERYLGEVSLISS